MTGASTLAFCCYILFIILCTTRVLFLCVLFVWFGNSNSNMDCMLVSLQCKIDLLCIIWRTYWIHYHIRALRHIRSSISEDMAKMVASALVGFRLDYANSVLYGTTQKNISKLQKAQNVLARVVTCSPRSSQSSSYNLLQHLHWFPIKHRINFKIANITFRTLQSSQPVYLR